MTQTLLLDFVANTGVVGGVSQANSLSPLTVVRSTSGYDLLCSTAFGANTARRTSAGLLIEPANTNLLPKSSDYPTNWNPGNSSITAAAATGPDGVTGSAVKLVEAANAGTHEMASGFISSTSGNPYTWWVVAKAADRSWLYFKLYDGANFLDSYFNLSTGTIGTVGTGLTASMISLGSGWYLCSLTKNAAGTSIFYSNGIATADGTGFYTGDGTSGIYLWGSQLQPGPRSSYVKNTTAGTATSAADAVSLTLPTGTDTLVYTFDDNSTQSVAVSAGSYTIPTNLNRSLIKSIEGTSSGGAATGSGAYTEVAGTTSGTAASGSAGSGGYTETRDGAAGLSGFSPLSLNPDVYAVAGSGVFSDSAGTSPQSTNGGTVNGWTNQGALGGRLTAPTDGNGPRLRPNGGNPYLEFGPQAGGGYRLGIASGLTTLGDCTIHAIAQFNYTGEGQTHRFIWSTAGVAWNENGETAAHIIDQFYNYNYTSSDGHAAVYTTIDPVCDQRWHILSWRRQSRVWTFYVDGQVVSTFTGTSDPNATQWNFGGGVFGAHFSGGIAAAYAVARADSDTDIANVCNYWLGSHPLLARPSKTLVVCGDSLSGYLHAESTPGAGDWLLPRAPIFQAGSWLQANAGLGNFWNNSFPGKTTAQHQTEVGRVAGWLNRALERKVVLLFLGANDLLTMDAPTAYAGILSLRDSILAAATGTKFVLATLPDGDPVWHDATWRARRVAFNTLVVNGASANNHGVARIDLTQAGATNAYIDHPELLTPNDGLHPIAPGMDQYAAAFETPLADALSSGPVIIFPRRRVYVRR